MAKKRTAESKVEDQPIAKRAKKLPQNQTQKNASTCLDIITKTPGLVHIAEQIFTNLNQENLKKCENVNGEWKRIVTNPLFLLKACANKNLLSPEQQQKWTKVIQALINSNLSILVIERLHQIHSGKVLILLPKCLSKNCFHGNCQIFGQLY